MSRPGTVEAVQARGVEVLAERGEASGGFGPVAWISTGWPVAVTLVTDQPAPLAQWAAIA